MEAEEARLEDSAAGLLVASLEPLLADALCLCLRPGLLSAASTSLRSALDADEGDSSGIAEHY